MTDIVLVNQTTVLTDGQVSAVVPVLQTLFDRDFEPKWNTGLAIRVSAASAAPAGAWPIYLQDTTDTPGAGGYHEDPDGTPFGKVFVKDAMDANESWTVDLTHEYLEMAGDPRTDAIVNLPGMPGYACLQEVCDACEDDALGYMIDGVLVSDWCTPWYFYRPSPGAHAFDHCGYLHAPAPALLQGGYLGIRAPDGRWGMVSMFDRAGWTSRRARRTQGRLNRLAARSV